MKIDIVELGDLQLYPGNARRHDIGAITASLQAHGQLKPLIVQTSSGRVLAGNGTLQAMLGMGWARAAVHFADVDDERARRILLVDNRTYDLGSYDDSALVQLLQGLDGLEGTGYDEAALDDLLGRLESEVELPAQPGTWGHAEPNRGPGEDPHPGLASTALRECLLLYSPDDLEDFRRLTEYIRRERQLPSTSAAVLAAVRSMAESMNNVRSPA